MTAVTIRPTFGKNERPSNGLEEISADLLKNQFDTHWVVGIVQFAGGNRPGPGEAEVPAVKFLGIEVMTGVDADNAAAMLDDARRTRGLGRMAESIPAREETLFDFDGDGHPTIPAETRMGPDGEHEVPPPSAEEELAERDEAKAEVIAANKAEEKRARLKAEREEAKAAAVPAAEFSGGAK